MWIINDNNASKFIININIMIDSMQDSLTKKTFIKLMVMRKDISDTTLYIKNWCQSYYLKHIESINITERNTTAKVGSRKPTSYSASTIIETVMVNLASSPKSASTEMAHQGKHWQLRGQHWHHGHRAMGFLQGTSRLWQSATISPIQGLNDNLPDIDLAEEHFAICVDMLDLIFHMFDHMYLEIISLNIDYVHFNYIHILEALSTNIQQNTFIVIFIINIPQQPQQWSAPLSDRFSTLTSSIAITSTTRSTSSTSTHMPTFLLTIC